MDKKKILLLKYFLKNCTNGYKVLELSSILFFVRKYKGNSDLLISDIKELAKCKYIDVKYLDDNNVCLSVMDNCKIFEENLNIERTNKSFGIKFLLLTMLCSGICAFVGAFVAIMLFR